MPNRGDVRPRLTLLLYSFRRPAIRSGDDLLFWRAQLVIAVVFATSNVQSISTGELKEIEAHAPLRRLRKENRQSGAVTVSYCSDGCKREYRKAQQWLASR